MAAEKSAFEVCENRDLQELRRHARYIVGDRERADLMAAETIAIMSGTPARMIANERPKQRNLRAFYHLNPGILQSQTGLAFSVLSLEILEGFSALQVLDILDLKQTQAVPAKVTARKLVQRPAGQRVMIVEHEALLAMEISEILTFNGNIIVGIARTSAQALECAKRVQPDLCFTGLHLADGSSGLETLVDFNGLTKCGPVIMLTSDASSVLRGVDPEPSFILEEPYTEEKLILMMALALKDPN